MHDHVFGVSALHQCILECSDREACFHAFIDRVPHDLVRAHVFERAHVQLALASRVFGDIDKPFLIKPGSGEITLDQVIAHRCSSTLIARLALADCGSNTRDLAQAPHSPLADLIAQVMEIIGKDPVATLRVLIVEFP